MTVKARYTDYQGRTVELTDEAWNHIVTTHPDMVGRLAELTAAVTTPNVIMADPSQPRVEFFYRASGELLTKVVVRYVPTPAGWVGTVKTAFPATRIPGKEVQLWP